MILRMKNTEGNRHDSSQRYFDGILAHETDFCWQQNVHLAEVCLHHPFVRGLAGGTLDPEAFRHQIDVSSFEKLQTAMNSRIATYMHLRPYRSNDTAAAPPRSRARQLN